MTSILSNLLPFHPHDHTATPTTHTSHLHLYPTPTHVRTSSPPTSTTLHMLSLSTPTLSTHSRPQPTLYTHIIHTFTPPHLPNTHSYTDPHATLKPLHTHLLTPTFPFTHILASLLHLPLLFTLTPQHFTQETEALTLIVKEGEE